MVNIKKTPLIIGLPLELGSLKLRAVEIKTLMAIMWPEGQTPALSVNVGEAKETEYGRLVWSSRNQGFLFGHVENADGVYLADISDGWVFFSLEGKDAEDVMARLAPIDLRRSQTPTGRSFRTQLGHLQALIITTENGFEIGVMSSFAKTAKHEIEEAMRTVEGLKSI